MRNPNKPSFDNIYNLEKGRVSPPMEDDFDKSIDPYIVLTRGGEISSYLNDTMSQESLRKVEMEQDAKNKAKMVHEEVFFNQGGPYRRMIKGIVSVFDGDGVKLRDRERARFSNRGITYNDLISDYLEFDERAIGDICQLMMDGVFDILNLSEEYRPVLEIKDYDENAPKYIRKNGQRIKRKGTLLGRYRPPMSDKGLKGLKTRLTEAERRGTIQIFLQGFGNKPDIRQILETLEHESFHAYQENIYNIPAETIRDRAMRPAYQFGCEQYVSSSKNYKEYHDQGYERSAREFADKLKVDTNKIMIDAMKKALGDE